MHRRKRFARRIFAIHVYSDIGFLASTIPHTISCARRLESSRLNCLSRMDKIQLKLSQNRAGPSSNLAKSCPRANGPGNGTHAIPRESRIARKILSTVIGDSARQSLYSVISLPKNNEGEPALAEKSMAARTIDLELRIDENFVIAHKYLEITL